MYFGLENEKSQPLQKKKSQLKSQVKLHCLVHSLCISICLLVTNTMAYTIIEMSVQK